MRFSKIFQIILSIKYVHNFWATPPPHFFEVGRILWTVPKRYFFEYIQCFKVLLVRKNFLKAIKFYLLWKRALLGTKMSQKGPRSLLGPPRMTNYFFELPGYENPMLGKRIFDLSPIEKKLG